MLSENKKFIPYSLLCVGLVNLLVYFVYHLAYHIGQYWFDLLADYVMDAWDCLIPAVGALLMLLVYSKRGIRAGLLYCLGLSAARLLYSIPYYYLFYMSSVSAPSSLDSITTSLLTSALTFVTFYLHTFALFGVGVLIYRSNPTSKEKLLSDLLCPCRVFDFSSVSVKIIFAISVIQLIYAMRVPVITTIGYFEEYGAYTRTQDLLHMLFNYVFVLCLFLVCHVVLCTLKNKLTAITEEEE